jgi:membrane-bound lytic murein transglycosylase D
VAREPAYASPLMYAVTLAAIFLPLHALALEIPEDDPGVTLELDELLDAELGDRTLPLTESQNALLRRLLVHDFAHTPSAERLVHARIGDELAWQRNREWIDEVEHAIAMARLEHRVAPKPEEPGVTYDIPLAEHPLVDAWIEHFTGRGRWVFERWLARADRYQPIMEPILVEHGLPKDTLYLAMIESGFVSHALSRSAASGFWQFMAPTGHMYGLHQDTWVDERRDFVKATHKAATYLTDLYKEFGDWHLAWAGYNAGGGRIRRALKRYDVRDFWTLIEFKDSLTKETKHYVPKIIAACIVARNRAYYGFTSVKSEAPLAWDSVMVDDSVEMRLVAKETGVSLEELRVMNPALLYDITPPRRAWELRVPQGTGEAVTAWLAATPKKERLRYASYTVQRGDTLGAIAKRLGSTIPAISELNGIRNPRSLRPGQRLVVPSARKGKPDTFMVARADGAADRGPADRPASRVQPASSREMPNKPVATHVVAVGDTLWSIAQKYNVSLQDLRRWNAKQTSKLGVGEILQIF